MKDPLYFEKIGDDFMKFTSDYDVRQRKKLIFKKLLDSKKLNKSSNCLEIGCGLGMITETINEHTTNLTVSDISRTLAESVAKRFKCKFIVGDCIDIPIPEQTFDIIISSECIEHTSNPYFALLEMKRILKKNGYLIITTPNILWYPVLLVAEKLHIRKFKGIEHWTSPIKLKHWLRKQGFTDIKFSGCHLLPWQIPGIKIILPLFDSLGKYLYPMMINYGFSAKKK